MGLRFGLSAVFFLTILTGPSGASPLVSPVFYNMPNGEIGYLQYFDFSYTGLGDNTTPLAPLSGGTGDLTNGVIGAEWNWPTQDVADPWVGWASRETTIVFRFAPPVLVTEMRLYTLRNTAAKVFIPAKISVSVAEDIPSLGQQFDEYVFDDAEFADNSLHTLSVATNIAGSFVSVKVSPAAVPWEYWTLFSEIEFVGTSALPGDANLDGVVDSADYTLWADHFDNGTGPGGKTWSQGDFTGEGYVTMADYTLWADNYGRTSAQALGISVVPEPTTLTLAALAILGGCVTLLRGRFRRSR